MSSNYSPLKLSSKDIQENYMSNTSPNDEQTSVFNNFNHYSSFPLDPNIQQQNINNDFSEENADSFFQKITFNKKNFDNFNEKNNENYLINELRNQYNERIQNLYNNMKMAISKIENDDILASMRDDMDSTNSPLINNRIKEILDENLYKEKEELIEKLSYENASLKNQLNDIIKNNNFNKIVY